jgi:hypothetical protein
MFSNGNSFSHANGNCTSVGVGKPVPTWKFGVSPGSFIEDRHDM